MKTNFNFKMNSKDIWMLLASIAFLIFFILIFIRAVWLSETPENSVEIPFEEKLETNLERQSITFILGEDKDSSNPYYTNATTYFRSNPGAKTDEVITNCTSISEIINTVNALYQKSGRKFDLINIVVHSNPWSGMNLSLEKGGKRITVESLLSVIDNGNIKPIAPEVVDGQTTIEFFACGLGENKPLINAFKSILFENKENAPLVKASNQYVNFTVKNELASKTEMNVYYAYYRTAYKPADLHLARQFRKRYPHVDIDWLPAIQNKTQKSRTQPFSYRYNVPVEWEILYPEYDVPELNTEMDKLEWLMNQDDLLGIVDKTGIPFDKFRWIIKSGKTTTEEGLEVPSIKVFGKVTILCILKEKEEFNDEVRV